MQYIHIDTITTISLCEVRHSFVKTSTACLYNTTSLTLYFSLSHSNKSRHVGFMFQPSQEENWLWEGCRGAHTCSHVQTQSGIKDDERSWNILRKITHSVHHLTFRLRRQLELGYHRGGSLASTGLFILDFLIGSTRMPLVCLLWCPDSTSKCTAARRLPLQNDGALFHCVHVYELSYRTHYQSKVWAHRTVSKYHLFFHSYDY